ncbi:MAG: 30S ribosomal protein S6 [Candidatus Omnitrophica bacterium]|nr:30S ribosomal protein S6 [Candidatus Omnitrophota bacterium]
MRSYEAVVIFPTQIPGEAIQEGKSAFEEVLRKQEGKVLSRTDLGKRFLGYTVKKQKEGHVICFHFELAPDKIEPLKRALQLSEGILYFTIVKKDKVKTKQDRARRILTAHTAKV